MMESVFGLAYFVMESVYVNCMKNFKVRLYESHGIDSESHGIDSETHGIQWLIFDAISGLFL